MAEKGEGRRQREEREGGKGGVRGGRRVLLIVMAHLDGQNNSWIKILHTSLTTDQQAWSSLQGNRNLCFHDTKHHSTDEGWGTGRGVGQCMTIIRTLGGGGKHFSS